MKKLERKIVLIKVNIEDFLLKVQRPARYIGNEYNSVRKDWDGVDVKVALAFPDIYEIGMSNLGLKILYHIINERADALAERVYSPWEDMDTELRNRSLPLFSLESRSPIAAFDILGITLPYEMSYTNVLRLLLLASIPLRSKDRLHGSYPLIIAGGPCAFNPEPLADFIDAFVIGDGEEAISQILDVYKKYKTGTREDLLLALTKIPGVYVPFFYEPDYTPEYILKARRSDVPAKIKKCVVDLEAAPYPTQFIVPNMEIVHNRGVMEVMRGCVHNCRFCQATMIYRPARIRSAEKVAHLVNKMLCTTGFGELSLSSLSASDYPHIYSLTRELMEEYEKEKVSLSLPSLRADAFSLTLANTVQQVRKSGLTFAPEAGTERLRKIINKDLSDEQLINSVKAGFHAGWRTIKLYFMIGLPGETQEDVEGIAQLVRKIKSVCRGINLNVAVSSFVPKPFSVFQWQGQEPMELLREKKHYLLKSVPAKVKVHDVELSFLEAVFARGDRRLGAVLEEAVKAGCHFDQWSDFFKFSAWMEVFGRTNIDPHYYAQRQIPLEETLPWEHIDCGVSEEYLCGDYQKAMRQETTPDCNQQCAGCGIEKCNPTLFQNNRPHSGPLEKADSPYNKTILSTVQKIRICYRKEGEARFISHLDLIDLFIKASRRARLPLAYSQGFNSHPKTAFGPPLPIGFESETEYADIELTKKVDLSTMVEDLNQQLPGGLHITKIKELIGPQTSIMSAVKGARYSVEIEGELKTADYQGMSIAGRDGNRYMLVFDVPLGQKNVRPDKVCEDIFSADYEIRQIKRLVLYSSMENEKEYFTI